MRTKKNSTIQPEKKTLITGIIILILSLLAYPLGYLLTTLICNNNCSLSAAVQAMTIIIVAPFIIGLVGLIVLINGIITYNKSKK